MNDVVRLARALLIVGTLALLFAPAASTDRSDPAPGALTASVLTPTVVDEAGAMPAPLRSEAARHALVAAVLLVLLVLVPTRCMATWAVREIGGSPQLPRRARPPRRGPPLLSP